MAMTLLSNNPVILMLLPDRILFQEILLTNNQGGPSKAKIQDMVATRHQSSSSPYATAALAASMADSDDGGDNADISQAIANSEIQLNEIYGQTGLAQMNNEKTTFHSFCATTARSRST